MKIFTLLLIWTTVGLSHAYDFSRTYTIEEAFEIFDQLDVVDLETLKGTWKGKGIKTGHKLDGALEAMGWYGKTFVNKEHVHPLVFKDSSGEFFYLNPIKAISPQVLYNLPRLNDSMLRHMGRTLKHTLSTKKSKARMRMVEHRGVVTAALIYDELAIMDSFRKVDENTVMGVMDAKGLPRPLFFLLTR